MSSSEEEERECSKENILMVKESIQSAATRHDASTETSRSESREGKAAARPKTKATTVARKRRGGGTSSAAPPRKRVVLSNDGKLVTLDDKKVEAEVAEEATASLPDDLESLLGVEWHAALRMHLESASFQSCMNAVASRRKSARVYPPQGLVFNAFKTTPLESIKVVIIGQDPYHQPGQAMGLCFSVARGVRVPPSLVNIFKEIGMSSSHGDLTSWAEQGVFLLNALLTVEDSKAMAHKKLGWEEFTDFVVKCINERLEHVVFMLWGIPAQKKGTCVDRNKHLVLESGHPSPLSHRFFKDCQHFAKANAYLEQHGKKAVDWRLLP